LILEDSSIITIEDYEASDLLMLMGMMTGEQAEEGPGVPLKIYLGYISDHLLRLHSYSENY